MKVKCLNENSVIEDIESRPLNDEDKLFQGTSNDSVFTDIIDVLKQKVEELEEEKRKSEFEIEEKSSKIAKMDENNRDIKKKNQLKEEKEKLLQRNQELERQISILRDYIEKYFVPIGPTEEAEEKTPRVNIDKGKQKVDEVDQRGNDDDTEEDVFVSSLCNRVKQNKRRTTNLKPTSETKPKVMI